MNIEKEIFKRGKIDYQKLIQYGFKKDNEIYKYSVNFMNDKFRADITININGQVTGKVWDVKVDDEYTNFRIENNTGEFAGKVKEEYQNILNDIKDKCFINEDFIYNQTNRIAKYIKDKYNVSPEFPWDSSPGCGVFRCPNNKWFGLIMNVDESKLNTQSGEVEIINIKAKNITELIKKEGYYRAYHMNKEKWLTILLNDTVKDNEIITLIDESYNLVYKNIIKG